MVKHYVISLFTIHTLRGAIFRELDDSLDACPARTWVPMAHITWIGTAVALIIGSIGDLLLHMTGFEHSRRVLHEKTLITNFTILAGADHPPPYFEALDLNNQRSNQRSADGFGVISVSTFI